MLPNCNWNTHEAALITTKSCLPRDIYHDNQNLRDLTDLINSGHFSHGDGGLFRPLIDNLLDSDPFLVCADFQNYIDCQEQVTQVYQDQENRHAWLVLNVARWGRFSSGRASREYNKEI